LNVGNARVSDLHYQREIEVLLEMTLNDVSDSIFGSVRPNKFLDAAFHRFDGGNKQKEVRVRTSTVKRGVFLGSR
jgi:hypothetical protein